MTEPWLRSFDIEGNLLFAHGQHEALDFEAAFAKVCDALQG